MSLNYSKACVDKLPKCSCCVFVTFLAVITSPTDSRLIFIIQTAEVIRLLYVKMISHGLALLLFYHLKIY